MEDNLNMEKDAVKAAADLKTANVNLIVYGCTSGSFVGGPESEKKLTQTLEEETGLPVITTTRAVIDGLRALNAKEIVVATPYPEEIYKKEKEFLEKMSFEVLAIRGLEIIDNLEVGRLAPEVAYRLAKEVFTTKADAVFVSCTNLRTIEIIETLESELAKPVITSTQASMWRALRELKIRERLNGYGKLLRENL
jgi:maleate isomerase